MKITGMHMSLFIIYKKLKNRGIDHEIIVWVKSNMY